MTSFQYPIGSSISDLEKSALLLPTGVALVPYAQRRIAFKRDAFVNTTALQDVSMQATGSTIIATNAPLGAAIEIVSTSVNDTAAGSGARTVTVHYLNSSFQETTLDVTLNGTTPVSLGTVCQYINLTHVLTIGTAGGLPAGTINIRNVATPTTIYSTVTGLNTSLTSIYTVPLGFFALINAIDLNVYHSTSSANNRVVMRAECCDWDIITTPGVFQCRFDNIYGDTATDNMSINSILSPLSTVKLSCTPSTAAGNLRISGCYALTLFKL